MSQQTVRVSARTQWRLGLGNVYDGCSHNTFLGLESGSRDG